MKRAMPAVLLVLALSSAVHAAPASRTLAASAYDYSLQAALKAIGDGQATLTVDGTLACDAPAVPPNVEVVVSRGGLLALGDRPLIVAGTLVAGRYPIFPPTGAVTGLRDPRPEWFGAGGLGKTDDTAAVQRAIDSEGDRPGGRVILSGKYAVTSLEVRRFGATIHCENAWLLPCPGAKADYLLRFAPSAHSATITGNLFVDMNYNLDYGCAINVNARHFTAHNVFFWRAKLAWLIGDPKWATSGIKGDAERGDSEIEIFGSATCHCLRAVEAVGANTIVKFTGCLLFSFPWTLPETNPRRAAWLAEDATLIRAIGALIYVDSGEVANFCARPFIDVQPIATTDPAYFSDYGKVYLTATHVECGNFFATSNPKGIVSRGRANSLSMIGCNGYMSSDNPVVTTDPLFTGGVLIQNCGFYREGRKSEIAVMGNPQATVRIDPASFFDAADKGLNAVRGGTQKFSGRLILQVQGADQKLSPAGEVVKFLTLAPLPDGKNFEACYDPHTGEFTCPYGGLARVTIRAAMAAKDGTPTDTAEVQVLRNGTPVFTRRVVGFGAEVEYTIPALAEGDKVAVKMLSPAGRALENGVGTVLQITASRY
jgi:hypothetical protein